MLCQGEFIRSTLRVFLAPSSCLQLGHPHLLEGKHLQKLHFQLRSLPALQTASGKKLAISFRLPSGSEASRDPGVSHPSTAVELSSGTELEYVGKGYRLVNCESLSQSVSKVGMCNACGSTLIHREDLDTRRGLCPSQRFAAPILHVAMKPLFLTPTQLSLKSLNARSILGMQEIGRGQASLEYFCGLMDMLPTVKTLSYRLHIRRMAEESMEGALQNMGAAAAHLHILHGVELTETIDIIATCDGTWCKRGFTVTHGIVVVIAWETGEVLDFLIMTKRCSICARKKTALGEE